MSAIDWFEKTRRNPLEIAKRFRQTDPLASRRIGQEGQQAASDFEPDVAPSIAPQTSASMSASEMQQRRENIAAQGVQATESARQLADINEAREAREAAARLAEEEAARRESNIGYPAYQGQGSNFQVSGELSDSRQDVLRRAGSFLGSPYQLGGRTVKGVDCSGLVMSVYNKAGFNITQHSATWQGRNIPGVRTSVRNLEPGDLVAWKDGSHIAIYAGNGMIIDASSRRGTSHRKLWAPESGVFGIKLSFPGE
jgi:cell wall-associated NlpC family hydrolase